MALAEIADFIVNVFQLIQCLYKVSIIIGKLLVEIIRYASCIVGKILQGIGYFMVVFYEDYSFFVEDFKNVASSIAIFFIDCLTGICGGVVKALISLGNAAAAGYHGVGELFSGRFLTVPIFTMELVKQILVIVGNGVWFLITLPVHLAKNCWDRLDEGLEIIGNFSKHVGAKSIEITSRLGHYMVKDVPLQSAAGICILILAYLNPKCSKRTAYLCFRILRYLYRKLLPYGRGIRRKYYQCKQRIAQLIISVLIIILAGFVYIRTRAIAVYETLIHRISLLFRNFFTVSDRSRRPTESRLLQNHPHLSRIDSRQDQSDSEPSSRSSSASSQQSNQSRSRQTFAQTSGNNACSSPSKKRSEGPTTIGLCIICEDNEKAVVLVPCGHMCLCKQCADQLGHYDRYCPICRTLILRKLDVFI